MINYIISNYPRMVGAAIISIFLLFIASRFAWGRWNKARRIIAADKFYSSVPSILEGLYPIPSNWPDNIDRFLRSKFPALQSAVNVFGRHLTNKEQIAFNLAWFRYRCSTGREIDQQCYHHYMPFISTCIVDNKQVTIDNSKTYTETFKHNVDSLLKFAKKT